MPNLQGADFQVGDLPDVHQGAILNGTVTKICPLCARKSASAKATLSLS